MKQNIHMNGKNRFGSTDKRKSARGMGDFLILWGTQSISSLVSAMTTFVLLLWAYEQEGTASSIAWLSVCSYLPSVFFCFAAGALADRWDKRKIMLISDLTAAGGTGAVYILYVSGGLELWHLYVVNLLISLMNAFQNPASYVAVSLLTPKESYTKAAGLQALSGSVVNILAPACASAVLAFSSIETVFLLDLLTFGAAFLTLLLRIRIPCPAEKMEEESGGFFKELTTGIGYLWEHRALLKMILFFSFINLLASSTGEGSILSAMVLSRTGNNQAALGAVSSAIGAGTLTGSLLVTALPAPKNRTGVIFAACGLSFILCNFPWAVGRVPWVWVLAGFLGEIPLPFLNANLTTIMRRHVPVSMQGRVFAARDTLQYATIPIGLALGGALSDRVFEPLMASPSPLQEFLSLLVGTGSGSGMAVLFLITGLLGSVSSFLCLCSKEFQSLNRFPENTEEESAPGGQ